MFKNLNFNLDNANHVHRLAIVRILAELVQGPCRCPVNEWIVTDF